MSDSLKAQTNKKWTSNEKYRGNWEKIFGKKDSKTDDNKELNEVLQQDTHNTLPMKRR